MPRLDEDRVKDLQPKRMEVALETLQCFSCIEIVWDDDTKIEFIYNGHKCTFYPYSGWGTGKTIKDGRGLANLTKQLKSTK